MKDFRDIILAILIVAVVVLLIGAVVDYRSDKEQYDSLQANNQATQQIINYLQTLQP